MKKVNITVIYVFLLLLFSNLNLFAAINTEEELKKYLDEKEKIFDDISVQMGIASWNIYSQEGEADTQVPRLRYLELFNDETLNNEIDLWYNKISEIKDNELKRRVEVWHLVLLGAKVDNDDDIFPLEDQLEKWLVNDESTNDRPSEAELEKLIKELMTRRNNKAISLGFNNYAEYQLMLNGLNIRDFDDVINKIEKATLPKYKLLIEEFLKENNKTEITLPDVIKMVKIVYKNKSVSLQDKSQTDSIITETFKNIGIDYKSLPIRFVEKDIPFGGNGLAVKIPTDFRIVIKPEQPIFVIMHELGHGMQGVFTKINSPILKGYEWCAGNGCGAFSEGLAVTSEKIVKNNEWLKKYAGYTEDSIRNKDSLINKYAAAKLRYHLVTIMLEIELYKNLDADPNAVRDSLYKKFLFVDSKPLGKFWYQDNITYVSYPVYLHNYFFADIISTQIHNHLKSVYGEKYLFNNKVGNDLINYLYSSGELLPWYEKMKRMTKDDLDIKGYLKSYGF